MTADDFKGWIAAMGWNDSQAASELALSRNSVAKYKREGAPLSIGLACAALAAGLGPWSREGRSQ